MELYVERGFEQTTVAEIAERAGLTARTFFRYFADKREVLFAGSAPLQEHLVARARRRADSALADGGGLRRAGRRRNRTRAAPRVLASAPVRDRANAELRERELIKMASLAAALADGLRRRGVPSPDASLAAEAGIAVLRVAFERWVSEPGGQELPQVMRESLGQLKTLTAGGGGPGPQAEGVVQRPQLRRELGAVPQQNGRHRVSVDPAHALRRVDVGVKSSVKNRSLFSRREAIRMKMRNAVSLKANPSGACSANMPDHQVDLLDIAVVDLAQLGGPLRVVGDARRSARTG